MSNYFTGTFSHQSTTRCLQGIHSVRRPLIKSKFTRVHPFRYVWRFSRFLLSTQPLRVSSPKKNKQMHYFSLD